LFPSAFLASFSSSFRVFISQPSSVFICPALHACVAAFASPCADLASFGSGGAARLSGSPVGRSEVRSS
jgi:hypothetical protein